MGDDSLVSELVNVEETAFGSNVRFTEVVDSVDDGRSARSCD